MQVTMNSFYLPEILQEGIVEGPEAHHALHVLRLKKGNSIRLHNGVGAIAQAVIVNQSKHSFHYQLTVIQTIDTPPYLK